MCTILYMFEFDGVALISVEIMTYEEFLVFVFCFILNTSVICYYLFTIKAFVLVFVYILVTSDGNGLFIA